MERYNRITDKNKREILLLKSFACGYGKCAFCNYILDNSYDEDEINEINTELLDKVTGEFGCLEIINSASVFELPSKTLKYIKKTADDKKIKTLYFEVYYSYIKRLDEIIKYFPNQEIRFKVGIETFDNDYRTKILKKNFILNDYAQLSKFYSCCLLICTAGQTKDQILYDIETSLKYFKEITINVFIDNNTEIKRDEKLVEWFITEIYPSLKDRKNIEILVDNKDLGVFVQ
jgi:hypothetical protein